MGSKTDSSGRWLFGPLPDLLLGCGVWYLIAFGLFIVAGPEIRESGARTLLLPLLVLLFGTPHYGATLVRVYERAEDRHAYAFFAIWATALIAAAFVAGVHSAWIGSWLLTIYLTWSPWHYTGQNYGLAVMFLRRRGVAFSPATKKLLYASFLLSFVMTFLAVHSGGDAESYTPVAYDSESYHFINLGIPKAFADPAFAVAAAAYAITLLAAAIQLLRGGSARDLLPTGMLVLSQALWFSLPLAFRVWKVNTGIEPWESSAGPYYFLWIAIAHSVQYIWVTSYYAKVSGRWSGQLPYMVKILFAGFLVWTGPALLFAPGLLGRLPFESGLGLLVASVVNIHHFVLDGAIWKLRSGRIASVLLRPRESAPPAIGPEGLGWVGKTVLGVGAACLAVSLASGFEREFGLKRSLEKGDLMRARTAAKRLVRLGRDGPELHVAMARALEQQGALRAAHVEYQRALELHPSVTTWHALGSFYAKQKRWSDAAQAFEKALAINPNEKTVLHHLGIASLELRQPERAREAFARAAELEPEREIHRIMLERAERVLRETAAPRGDSS